MLEEDKVLATVLVVDDNEEILEFLADDLEDKYKVLTVTNVKAAFEVLEKNMIELIISDVIMPEIDGYTFCNLIKSNIEYSHIPFILLTAKNTLHSKIEGLENGADAYIDKPFSPEYLQAQIASLLINRGRMKEFFSSYPQANLKTVTHSSADEKFLTKLNSFILQNLGAPELDVDALSNSLYISRPTLYRKIKAILDITPNDLINITRLKRAAELLVQDKYSITEISMMVGFNSATHFGRSFLKQFGTSPSTYLQKVKESN
ncbi:response regulator transcription factor [Arachidicoccus soli]|uniref:DNA-binding response regulator n=1 Tax=Arachidicoccus soli TaxID=2341117 RepID=A0A386HPA6_9BACT|nr:response regulator [Arachidicoccus soli]AYD47767.1 DNA-binding response regulator [Arachidicoccus soli]